MAIYAGEAAEKIDDIGYAGERMVKPVEQAAADLDSQPVDHPQTPSLSVCGATDGADVYMGYAARDEVPQLLGSCLKIKRSVRTLLSSAPRHLRTIRRGRSFIESK